MIGGDFINNLISILKDKHLTFKKLSELTGYSVTYLSYLAHGKRNNPSYECLDSISKALNVDISDLFGGGSNFNNVS